MKHYLFLIITLLLITTLNAQSTITSNKTIGKNTLPNNFIGEWTDECVLDISNKIFIKKEGDVFKATFKLGNVQVKSFSKIEGITKLADGSYDLIIAASTLRHKINIKNVNAKVVLVKKQNDKKQTPLYSCSSIMNQDEFDQLYEKYNHD